MKCVNDFAHVFNDYLITNEIKQQKFNIFVLGFYNLKKWVQK
jgi:hypothetical protein